MADLDWLYQDLGFETELFPEEEDTEPEPLSFEELGIDPSEFYYGQRGMLGDMGSLAAEAAVSGLEVIENAAEFFNLNDSEVDMVSKLRTFDLLKPDIDEFVGEGAMGGFEAFGHDLGTPRDIARTVGASATGLIPGLLIGGVPGAIMSSFGLMGASEYQQTYEHAIQEGLSHAEASELAGKVGGTEAFGEAIGTAIGLGPVLKGFTRLAKQPLKHTLNGMLKTSPKAIAKQLGITYAEEQATEFGQAGLQNKFMREAGLTDETQVEALVRTILPTMFLTGAFNLGTNVYTQRQKSQLKAALNGKDKGRQKQAIDMITRNLAQEDPAVSKAWDVYSKYTLASGANIDWNAAFDSVSKQILEMHGEADSLITEADILKGGPALEAKINKYTAKGIMTQRDLDFFEYEPDLPTEGRTLEQAEAEDVAGREERLRREAAAETAAINAKMDAAMREVPETDLPEGFRMTGLAPTEENVKFYEDNIVVPGEAPVGDITQLDDIKRNRLLVRRLQDGKRKAKEARTAEQKRIANEERNATMQELFGEYTPDAPGEQTEQGISKRLAIQLGLLSQTEQDAMEVVKGNLTVEQSEVLAEYNRFIEENTETGEVPARISQEQVVESIQEDDAAAFEEGVQTKIAAERPAEETLGVDTRKKTVVQWKQLPEAKLGKRISAALEGTLPGSDTKYRLELDRKNKTVGAFVQEDGKWKPVGQPEGNAPGQYNNRAEAFDAIEGHAATVPTEQWKRSKAFGSSITVDGNTYTIKPLKSAKGKIVGKEVLLNGEPMPNPERKNGKWIKRKGKSTTQMSYGEIEAVIEKQTGFTPAAPVAPEAPAAPTAPVEPTEPAEPAEPTKKTTAPERQTAGQIFAGASTAAITRQLTTLRRNLGLAEASGTKYC
jgi:hypothetical protein